VRSWHLVGNSRTWSPGQVTRSDACIRIVEAMHLPVRDGSDRNLRATSTHALKADALAIGRPCDRTFQPHSSAILDLNGWAPADATVRADTRLHSLRWSIRLSCLGRSLPPPGSVVATEVVPLISFGGPAR